MRRNRQDRAMAQTGCEVSRSPRIAAIQIQDTTEPHSTAPNRRCRQSQWDELPAHQPIAPSHISSLLGSPRHEDNQLPDQLAADTAIGKLDNCLVSPSLLGSIVHDQFDMSFFALLASQPSYVEVYGPFSEPSPLSLGYKYARPCTFLSYKAIF